MTKMESKKEIDRKDLSPEEMALRQFYQKGDGEKEGKKSYEEIRSKIQPFHPSRTPYRKIPRIEPTTTPEYHKERVKSLLTDQNFLQKETKIGDFVTNYLNSQYDFNTKMEKISEISDVEDMKKAIESELEKRITPTKTIPLSIHTVASFGGIVGGFILFILAFLSNLWQFAFLGSILIAGALIHVQTTKG